MADHLETTRQARRALASSASEPPPRLAAERLIAGARLGLALVSLLALWVDPSTPAQHVAGTLAVLAVFLAYAGALAAGARWAPVSLVRSRKLAHVVDLAAFSTLMYMSEGPNSPFFLFFTFSLIAATLRWQWRGVAWTALSILIVYGLLAWSATTVLGTAPLEIDRYLIRNVYLAVAAGLLGYLGWYQETSRSEMSALAAWRPPRPAGRTRTVAAALARATRVLRAPRAVLVWESTDEPWVETAEWNARQLTEKRQGPPGLSRLVDRDLAAHDFVCLRADDPDPLVWFATRHGPQRRRAPPMARAFIEEFRVHSVLALVVRGSCVRGRLLLLDRSTFTIDDLVPGRIVADRVANALDQFILRARLRQTAIREERSRLSRDLHDGVLQSLAGAALQLEAIDAHLHQTPDVAREQLRRIRRFLADEQRDLRILVHGLRPHALRTPEHSATFHDALAELADRFRTVWNLEIDLQRVPADRQLPKRIVAHVYALVQEALANSARHGRASHARVCIDRENETLRLEVADNGNGFPFTGSFQHDELQRRAMGPASLQTRVASLNGTLAIESSAAGARIEIVLPITSADRRRRRHAHSHRHR